MAARASSSRPMCRQMVDIPFCARSSVGVMRALARARPALRVLPMLPNWFITHVSGLNPRKIKVSGSCGWPRTAGTPHPTRKPTECCEKR